MCARNGPAYDERVLMDIRSDCSRRKLAPRFGCRSEYSSEFDICDWGMWRGPECLTRLVLIVVQMSEPEGVRDGLLAGKAARARDTAHCAHSKRGISVCVWWLRWEGVVRC